MGAATRDERNEVAKALLDWGFSKYCIYRSEGGEGGPVNVTGGMERYVPARYSGTTLLLPIGKGKDVTVEIEIIPSATAPVKVGDRVGLVRYILNGECIAEEELVAAESVEKIGFMTVLRRLFSAFTLR